MEIVQKIKECRAWSIMFDTTPDITNIEQVSICVRIVANSRKSSEHLLGCQEASSTAAAALYGVIEQAFKLKSVPLDKPAAQTYDGASNMERLLQRIAGNCEREDRKTYYICPLLCSFAEFGSF